MSKRKFDTGSPHKSTWNSPSTKTKKLKRDGKLDKLSFEEKIAASVSESNQSKSGIKIKEKEPEFDDVTTTWLHSKLEFLRPDKIRDAEKRQSDHPQYDPTTLFVPESYLNTLTPVNMTLLLISIVPITNKIGFCYRLCDSGGYSNQRISIRCYFSKLENSMSCTTWMRTLELMNWVSLI